MSGHGDNHLRVRTPADMLWAVRRHWRRALTALAATVILSLLAYRYMPRKYESEAKLLVRVGRETVRLDPTVMGPTMSVSQSRRNEINSEVEILRSEDLHLQLVDELGHALFLPGTTLEGEAARHEAARVLGAKLRVDPGIDSDIITASFRHATSAGAQTILRRLLELYLEKHTRAYQTEGSLEFFETQNGEINDRIAALRSALHEKHRQLGIRSLESREQALIARRAVLVSERETTASAIAAGSAKALELQEAIGRLEETIIIERSQGNPNAATEHLKTRLAELKIQERELQSKGYLPDNPVVAAVTEQIRLVTQLLERESEERTIVREAVNPNRQRLELELMLERAALAALNGKNAEQREQITEIERQLDELERNKEVILGLQTELSILEAKRQGYLESLEQARMDEALSKKGISNISIVQQATLPMRPAGPPRVWILIVGGVLSFFTTVVVILLCDYYDAAFLLPSDVHRALATDLRAALPSVWGLRMPISHRADPKQLEQLPPAVVQEFEMLVGRVLALGSQAPVIAVTAARTGAGVSTVAFHLAARLAAARNARTVLVDANEGDAALSKALIAGLNGKSQPLPAPIDLRPTAIPYLYVLPRPGGFLGNGALRMAIERCKEEEVAVVIDLPPVSTSAVAIDLAKSADRTLFVVDSMRTDVSSAQRALGSLVEAEAKLLGTILNRQIVRMGAS